MPSPPPPLLNALLDLDPRGPVPYKEHGDTQALGIAITTLVIEEQHILVRNARAAANRLEMPDLAAGINLQPGVEKLDGLARLLLLAAPRRRLGLLPAGRRRERRGGRDVEHLEEVAGEVRRVGARGDGELDPRGARQGGQDGGHVGVEGVGFAVAVGCARVGGVGFQGRGDMGVDPEGPEGVV